MKPPSIHDQYEEIIGFVIEKCEEEERLYHMTHALTANEEAPACEMLETPAKFEAWEEPGAVPTEMPWGKPAHDGKGNYLSTANLCPYCAGFTVLGMATPLGATVECLQCHSKFRRAI